MFRIGSRCSGPIPQGFAGTRRHREKSGLVQITKSRFSSGPSQDESISTDIRSRVRSLLRDSSASTTTASSASDPPLASPESDTYRAPTPPTGVPLSRLLSNSFPLSYRESFTQWLDRSQLQKAEDGVLSLLPFYPSDGTRSSQTLDVPIGGGDHIHEYEITREHEPIDRELVVLHGYGAGLGFFYRIFDHLSSFSNTRVHALDLLGYGLSSRPKFKVRSKDTLRAILETEEFFTSSLEAWRKQRGIEQFTLVAHSLGAYLGAAYAMKYPGRVKKLMMVSPAGVPRNYYSLPIEQPQAPTSSAPSGLSKSKSALSTAMAKELPKATQAKVELARKLSHSIGNTKEASGKAATNSAKKPFRKAPLWFHFLWECHWSPFSLVRNTGPLGPRFVSGWTSRRFAQLPAEHQQALHLYAYAIFNAPGSGEYALNYLLAPGAHGRRPLAERAHLIPCSTTWVYGTEDWMDRDGGRDACTNVNQNSPYTANLVTVKNAGHHIYIDNPQDLNNVVTEFLQ